MKKILLSSLAILFSCSMFAQRTIDWSLEEIVSPTKIEHQTAIDIHYIAKNNGTDTAMVGDSFYSVYTLNGQLNLTRVVLLDKRVNPGDTIHLVDNLPALNVNNPSFNGSFRIASVLQNRPDLNLETNATATNNIKTVTIPYIGSGGFGVSVSSIDASTFSAYPSPAVNTISFNVPLSFETKIDASIVDMAGKTVLSQNFNFSDALSMDVSTLSNGVYILNVKTGDVTHQTKITIAK